MNKFLVLILFLIPYLGMSQVNCLSESFHKSYECADYSHSTFCICNRNINDTLNKMNIIIESESERKEYNFLLRNRNDSVFILTEDLMEFPFFKYSSYKTSEINALNRKNPDKFYPFGNIVYEVDITNESFCVISLLRTGAYTTSLDSYISKLIFKKGFGIVSFMYFDGTKSHNFTEVKLQR